MIGSTYFLGPCEHILSYKSPTSPCYLCHKKYPEVGDLFDDNVDQFIVTIPPLAASSLSGNLTEPFMLPLIFVNLLAVCICVLVKL